MKPRVLEEVEARLAALKRVYKTTWEAHHREIGAYVLPTAGRWDGVLPVVSDRYRDIIDDTGTAALQVLAAGLMAGATSPMRPWMRLVVDDGFDTDSERQLYSAAVTAATLALLQRTNAYPSLQQLYEEMGAFGVGACLTSDHPERLLHFYPLTIGEYWIAASPTGEVNTCYREFSLSVAQVVAEFGLENCSPTVRSQFENRDLESTVRVAHAIEPRRDRDPTKRTQRNMPWRSVYWEVGQDTLLREGGFSYFPVLAARWSVCSTDAWGTGPGSRALPPVRQLQMMERSKGLAIEKMVDPPTQAPSDLKMREVDGNPGAVNYTDAAAAPNAGIRSIYEVKLDIAALSEDQREVRGRVNSAFFADLFLMLFQTEKTMSATEAAALQQEKMLMLGPVLERLSSELFVPLISLAFDALARAGMLPEAPAALAGKPLTVEFLSVLAQAQRAAQLGLTDRFIASVQSVSAQNPDVLDVVDFDEWARDAGTRLGVNPKMIRKPADVAALRDARNKAMAAQQQVDMAAKQAGAQRDLAAAAADAPVGVDNFSGLVPQ